MRIETQNVVIRTLEKKDAKRFYSIARESAVYRYMPDWADGRAHPKDYYGLIDQYQKQSDNTDISIGRSYAIALPNTDEMIGSIGVGLKEKLNEIELGYFMSEKHQRNGYTREAISALAEWCFEVSDVKYLILTINCANVPSNKLAEKCGFKLLERRTPIGDNHFYMENDSYFYYRSYRK
ncbi:GNAT family N-acetyltransferase [Paenibacillus sp. Y412MC10]|uniref:GNAT family N-acetyltransferase n=1 Tax=Geobacillus sp. (strain Y412MC10) TaxID=481743 RepID=UPI0011A48506|nr:GNAT family N-acetyltransferase [Paenibacillus sp. Y412MC10]